MVNEQPREPSDDLGPGGLRAHVPTQSDVDPRPLRSPLSPRFQRMAVACVAYVVVAVLLYFFVGWIGLVGLSVVTVLSVGAFFYRQRLIQRKQSEAFREDERQYRHRDIVTLRNRRPRSMTIFVANQSGDGSKTTTCAYLALTFMARLRGVPVIIVECRRDSAQGVDKHRLDAGTVTTIREFHRLYRDGALNDEQGRLSNELVFEKLMISELGICYLQADPKTPKDDSFNVTAASEVIRVLKTTGAIIIIDSGNNPSDPITIGMANESALGVFPSMPTSKSLTLRKRTMETFEDHVRSPIVDYSISVLSAYEEGNSLDTLLARMGSVPEDRLFITRFDPYMQDDPVEDGSNDGTKVADLDKILPENRDVFEQMAQRLLELFVRQGESSGGATVRPFRSVTPPTPQLESEVGS